MLLNQRARLVLHPVVLISLLVVVGFAVGLGIVWRKGSSALGARGSSASTTSSLAGLQISSDHLDFGTIALDRAVSRQLRLGNNGKDSIALRIEGGDAFNVDPRRLTIAPRSAARVLVTAKPTTAGTTRDELRVFEDGASDPALVVSLAMSASADAPVTSGVASGSDAGSGGAVESDASAIAGSAIVYGGHDGANAETDSGASADGSQPVGSVQISRTIAERGGEAADPGSSDAARITATGSVPGIAFDTTGRTIRGMGERPTTLPVGAPPREGEEPIPIPHNNPDTADELEQNSNHGGDDPSAPASFSVGSSSALSLMGTMNRFYPQQIAVSGSASSSSFSLLTGIQFPRIPLAFGQSMNFTVNGPVAGSFDRSSGQVTLTVALNATDSNGRTAPVQMSLTTGSVVTRNPNGILVSVSGQPRSGSGQLRLVGIGKIPMSYGNAAEQQLVMIDMVASLVFPSSGQ